MMSIKRLKQELEGEDEADASSSFTISRHETELKAALEATGSDEEEANEDDENEDEEDEDDSSYHDEEEDDDDDEEEDNEDEHDRKEEDDAERNELVHEVEDHSHLLASAGDGAGIDETSNDWEMNTRSRQPFMHDLHELDENFWRKEEADDAVMSSITSSVASEDDDDSDDDDSQPIHLPWEHINDDDDDDEDDEDYNDEDAQKEWMIGSEDDEEEDDDEGEHDVSDSEVEDLTRTNPSTLLQPHDIKRIREVLRGHIQLLVQLMMLAASANQPHIHASCARMLEDIVQLGNAANLPESIMKGAKPDHIQALLDQFKEELKHPLTPKEVPTWKQPIIPRYDAILTRSAPMLGFISKLYPAVKRQKIHTDRKRKNWRNWATSEIKLVVLGFDKYGGRTRSVAQKIHSELLPTRESHTITRVINEAQTKKKFDPKFQPILNWLKQADASSLSADEERRLRHGVALQNVNHIKEINFQTISTELLPHLSAEVLKKRMEELIHRDKQLEDQNLQKTVNSIQQSEEGRMIATTPTTVPSSTISGGVGVATAAVAAANAGLNTLLKAVATASPHG